jgi:hypothetical protein
MDRFGFAPLRVNAVVQQQKRFDARQLIEERALLFARLVARRSDPGLPHPTFKLRFIAHDLGKEQKRMTHLIERYPQGWFGSVSEGEFRASISSGSPGACIAAQFSSCWILRKFFGPASIRSSRSSLSSKAVSLVSQLSHRQK